MYFAFLNATRLKIYSIGETSLHISATTTFNKSNTKVKTFNYLSN